MGQEEIIKEIVERGEVPQKELNNKFGCAGQVTRQLQKLRDKGLAGRRLINRREWLYFPTQEAIELYKKEVAK